MIEDTEKIENQEERKLTKKERRKLAKEERKKIEGRKILFRKLRKFLVWVFATVFLIFTGSKVWVWLKSPSPEVAGIHIEVKDDDWIKGKKEAKVTLIEYGDYQCPACATYNPLIERLLEEFPNDLKVVYRHFPIQSHKNAFVAAQAAEAAGRQGKFWEMHNLLYERQSDWEGIGNAKDKFVSYAKELNLDESKFLSDYDSQEVKDSIIDDVESGRLVRITYTPTFILNGSRIQPRSYEEFKKEVEVQIRGYTIE